MRYRARLFFFCLWVEVFCCLFRRLGLVFGEEDSLCPLNTVLCTGIFLCVSKPSYGATAYKFLKAGWTPSDPPFLSSLRYTVSMNRYLQVVGRCSIPMISGRLTERVHMSDGALLQPDNLRAPEQESAPVANAQPLLRAASKQTAPATPGYVPTSRKALGGSSPIFCAGASIFSSYPTASDSNGSDTAMGLRPTATSASDAATWSNPVTLHRTPDRRRETSYPASEAGNASVCPAQGNEMAGVLSLDAREGENRQERDHGAASGAKWDPVQSVASRVASCAPSKWGSTCPTCGHAEDYEADGPATSRRPVHSSKLVIATLLLRECQISLSGRYFHAWWRCVVSSGPARGCVDNLAVVVEKVCCGGGGALFNQQASRASKLWNNSGFEQQMIPRNSSADASSITSPEEGTTKANSCTNGCRVVLSRAASSCQSPARICAPFDLKRRDTCAESSVLHSATGAPLGGVNDCVVASLAKSIPKGVWRSPNYRRAPSSAVSKLQVYLDIVQEEESGRRTILERKESAFRSGIQTLANEVLEKDFKDAICKTRAALLRGCSRSRGTPSGSPSGKGVDESRLKPTRQGSSPVAKPSPNKRNLRDELGSIDSAESGNTRLLETDQTVFSPVRTPGNGSPGKSANSHVILGGNGAFVDCDASHDAPKHPTDMGKAAEPGGPSGSSTEGVGVVMQDSPHQVHLESTTEVFPINGNIERRRQSVMSSDELLNFNIQRLVEMDLDVREHEQRVYIANKYRTGLRRIIWICFGNRPCLSKDAGHGR